MIPVFHYALRPHGFLLLGTAESVGGFADLFALVDSKFRIYEKKFTHSRVVGVPGFVAPEDVEPRAGGRLLPARQSVEPMLADIRKQADAIVLSQFSPNGVVVNSSMEILQFRGVTGQYLEHAPGEATLSLLKMARQGLAVELRPLISKAVKQKHTVSKEGVKVSHGGSVIATTIRVVPFQVPPSSDSFFLVLFEEKASALLPSAAKSRAASPSPLQRELSQLRDELGATKLSLQTIIEEQDASNEELRAANEEILSSNEELQSTNEELETAQEELQSTNEELTTLNDELQNRNVELQQVGDDLVNLFGSVDVPIVMLSNDLRIRRFTPRAEKVFNLIPSDVGRPITDLKIPIPDLPALITEVLESLSLQQREVQDHDGRWYQLRLRPYKTTDNRIDGVVLTLSDIDAVKRSLAEAEHARQFAEAIVATVREPLLVLDGELRVTMANHSFYDLFRVKPAQTERKHIFELGDGQWNIPALRELLEKILPAKSSFQDFRVEHDFPGIGRKTMLLNARRLETPQNQLQWILLAMEDVTNRD